MRYTMRLNAALSHQPYCVPVADPAQPMRRGELALLSSGGPIARFSRGALPVLAEDDEEDAPTRVLPSLRRPREDEHVTFIDKALAPQIRERAARAQRS